MNRCTPALYVISPAAAEPTFRPSCLASTFCPTLGVCHPQTLPARIVGMRFEDGRDGTKHFVVLLDARSDTLQDIAKWEEM